MTWLLALAAFVLAPASAQSQPQDAGLSAALQGTWTISSVNGQALSSLGQKSSMAFKGNTYTVTTNGQVKERGTFKIDGRRKPAEIDMTINEGVAVGSTQIGIVQIVNGELTLKTNTVGTPNRPVDFKHEFRYVLIVAKKDR